MAKRFEFRLQPVLRWRALQEDETKRAFAEANRAAEEVRMTIRSLQAERAGAQGEIRDLYEAGQGFQDVVETYRYVNALERQIAGQGRKLAELEKALDEKRQALIEARTRRQALEHLRERRQEDHRRLVDREEQAGMDEQGLQLRRLAVDREGD